MKIQHDLKSASGRFFIQNEDGKEVAELTYTVAKDPSEAMVIEHTHVDDSLRGQGVARKLVDAANDWARQQDLKVKPVCAYARSVFDKDPSLSELRCPEP